MTYMHINLNLWDHVLVPMYCTVLTTTIPCSRPPEHTKSTPGVLLSTPEHSTDHKPDVFNHKTIH